MVIGGMFNLTNDTLKRKDMYIAYKEELNRIEGCKIPSKFIMLSWYNETIQAADDKPNRFEWMPIMDSGKEVGFLVLDNYDKGKIFVGECYIKPGYRRKGLMTEAMNKVISRADTFLMDIIDNNVPARNFWCKYFIGKNYYLKKYNKIIDGEHTYSFERCV